MEQVPLYACIREAGFEVLTFEDHPQFFGNWRVGMRRGEEILEVECDNRDGVMTLWRHRADGGLARMAQADNTRMGRDAQLQMLRDWLRAET